MEKITWSEGLVTEDMDCCSHVSVGDKVNIKSVYDCCGTSYVYACCPMCANQAQTAEDEELFECTQCGQQHPKKDMRFWWHYDDNKVEDDPYTWCPGCQDSMAVQALINEDKVRMEEELDMYDEDEDDEGEFFNDKEEWLLEDEEDPEDPSDDILKN